MAGTRLKFPRTIILMFWRVYNCLKKAEQVLKDASYFPPSQNKVGRFDGTYSAQIPNFF